jgi:ribonuclease/clavin/mitogillin
VDSGWDREQDRRAIDAWLADVAPRGRAAALIVTHAHRDHIGGLRHLARSYGLTALALAPERDTARRHGLDAAFETVAAGSALDLGGGVRLSLLATPGHTPGGLTVHLPARAGEGAQGVLFTGDTVVGRHSAWVGPPDGDLDVYLDTLARLADAAAPWAGARLAPGHGPAGGPAGQAAQALRVRRLGRDDDILRLLGSREASARALAHALYGAGGGPILGAGGVAERTVLAHLERLRRLGRVRPKAAEPDPALTAWCRLS